MDHSPVRLSYGYRAPAGQQVLSNEELGACPRIRLGQNLTSQNAPESTIGDLGGVLLPPKIPIFVFLGQAPRDAIMP